MINANWKLRILNYLIDTITIVIIFYLVLELLVQITKHIPSEFSLDFSLVLLFVFVLYYLLFESISGKTIGKYITRTVVVSDSGNKPAFIRILLRSIVRIFFIEVFSFFSSNPSGWHDRISGTKVVVIKK